jgi:8-oxo-dGTP pyrophosphatase MutT (NUDIX family)
MSAKKLLKYLNKEGDLDSDIKELMSNYRGMEKSVGDSLNQCPTEEGKKTIQGKFNKYTDAVIKKGISLNEELTSQISKRINRFPDIAVKKHSTASIIHKFEDGKDKILFLRRSKGDEFEPGTWCLPGGGIEYKENVFDSARREIWEETGLKINDIYLKGVIDLPKIVIYYFEGYLESNQEIILDYNEHENYQWCCKEEWCKMDLILDCKQHLKDLFNIDPEPAVPEIEVYEEE